jgi:PAS domain S-box-containing protein
MQTEPKVNILLVDDHTENLIALEAVLGNLEQNLVRAHSGEEALRCLLNQDFAVILLDVQMPGMDGFETATLIRQRNRSRHTPIIFLTAFNTNDALIFKGYALGAVDYLFKPLDPTILTSKVAVFVDLFKKTAEVKRQASQLSNINAELRQSEERFRSLSACSPVGIFLLDIDGKCTYANPRCQAICGFTLEESLGEGWMQFLHPEDQDRAVADWRNYTQQQQETAFEYRFQNPDGNVCWTHIRSSPMFSDSGDLIGHVGTVEDITQRKQADAVREQFLREQAARQQAEAANRMKDEFLAIVSHELRTPLNSILGWSQMLLTRELSEETKTRALETIERNAKAQAQLIADILDVSQIIRGKLRLAIQNVDLIALVDSVLESVHPLAEAKSVQLSKNLSASAQTVSADPERLRQVIWNLLSNAIKFTPEGGQIEVRLDRVDRVKTANGSTQACAQLQVIDTGIGITPDFLPHVFDRFRQADSTTARSYSGLGLGLAIARHLIDLHQGEICAYSEGEGQGATFTVYLPLVTLAPAISEPTLSQAGISPQEGLPSLDQAQVLVVEDNIDTRDFIAMILEEAGATVAAVASANEAIACLEQFHPHLLISDIGLPEEDGYQFVRKLRMLEQKTGRQIPAIALTAYARHEDQLQVLAAGFQMHLAKPIGPSELVTAAAALIQPSKPAIEPATNRTEISHPARSRASRINLKKSSG